MKRSEISILIPVHNYICLPLVKSIQRQADDLGVQYEIIVADDGSTQPETIEANKVINALDACRFIQRETNVGRSAIRNFLVQKSRFSWLLFMDCDMKIDSPNFLQHYMEADGGDVVDGGIAISGDSEQWKRNLRYRYELHCAPQHTAEERTKHPYRSFRTTNFMVKREVMLQHPFDERFRHYGYEDVLLGKTLRQHHVPVAHIDNPLGFCTFERNPDFVAKTEEGLRTLHAFRAELRGYSRLLTLTGNIHLPAIRTLIRLFHRIFGRLERRNLCGSRPNLLLFKLYRLGYFLMLEASRTPNPPVPSVG